MPEVRPIAFDPAVVRSANGEVAPAAQPSTASTEPARTSPTVPPSSGLDPVRDSAAVLEAEEEAPLPLPDTGPNWMLAFVCAWSGTVSINEAWAVASAGGQVLSNLGFLGYALLGLGLLAFAVEALRWGRRRSGAVALLLMAATLLTLAGLVCLLMWPSAGRKI